MEKPLQLTPQQIADFRERGFLLCPSISDDAEVERLRGIFDRLFSTRAGWKKGAQFDLAGRDEADAPARLPQILNPVQFAPELAQTRFRENALAIARQLLGEETEAWFEHAISKPPRYGAATPWHQDEAHRDDAGVDYEQISIWMPLQPATIENGCMQFIPGSHLGPVLEHRSPENDPRVTALECVGAFDPRDAVVCPLPAGGATVHHCRTLHAAGPNACDAPRHAYIIAFRGPVKNNPERKLYRWNAEKQTAAQARAAAWRNRGGAVGRAMRRAGEFARRIRGKLGRIVRG